MNKSKNVYLYIASFICLSAFLISLLSINMYQPIVHTLYLIGILLYFVELIYKKQIFYFTSIGIIAISFLAFYADYGLSGGNLSGYGWTTLATGISMTFLSVVYYFFESKRNK